MLLPRAADRASCLATDHPNPTQSVPTRGPAVALPGAFATATRSLTPANPVICSHPIFFLLPPPSRQSRPAQPCTAQRAVLHCIVARRRFRRDKAGRADYAAGARCTHQATACSTTLHRLRLPYTQLRARPSAPPGRATASDALALAGQADRQPRSTHTHKHTPHPRPPAANVTVQVQCTHPLPPGESRRDLVAKVASPIGSALPPLAKSTWPASLRNGLGAPRLGIHQRWRMWHLADTSRRWLRLHAVVCARKPTANRLLLACLAWLLRLLLEPGLSSHARTAPGFPLPSLACCHSCQFV